MRARSGILGSDPGAPGILRNPNQLCIICSPALGREIPVIDIPEPPGVAIEKSKLCAAIVQVGVDVVLLSDARKASVVKQPNRRDGPADRRDFYRPIIFSGAVDVLIEAVMEQVIPIAALGIGRANPNRTA